MNKQNKDWEKKLKESLENAGLKPIQFKMNNSGVRILNFVSNLIEEAEEELMAEFLNQPANQHDQEVRKQAQSEIIQIIEDMPTNFPEREDDSFDQGAKHFRDKLLEII